MQITDSIKKSAADLFSTHSEWSCLYVNERGEFFTREDYAGNSVEGDKDKFVKIEPQEVEGLTETEQVSVLATEVSEPEENKEDQTDPVPKTTAKKRNLKTS